MPSAVTDSTRAARVIALVGDQGPRPEAVDQRACLRGVVALPGSREQAERITGRAHRGMNLGGEAAPAAA